MLLSGFYDSRKCGGRFDRNSKHGALSLDFDGTVKICFASNRNFFSAGQKWAMQTQLKLPNQQSMKHK
jgi:hypothetical protein